MEGRAEDPAIHLMLSSRTIDEAKGLFSSSCVVESIPIHLTIPVSKLAQVIPIFSLPRSLKRKTRL